MRSAAGQALSCLRVARLKRDQLLSEKRDLARIKGLDDTIEKEKKRLGLWSKLWEIYKKPRRINLDTIRDEIRLLCEDLEETSDILISKNGTDNECSIIKRETGGILCELIVNGRGTHAATEHNPTHYGTVQK